VSKSKISLDKLSYPEWQTVHHFVYKMNSMFPWVDNNCPTPYDFAEVLEACGFVFVSKAKKPLEDTVIEKMEQEFLLRGFVIDGSDERVEDGIRPSFEVALDMTADLDEVSIVRR
jgi:hypothetical protein